MCDMELRAIEILGLPKIATVHALARAREYPGVPFADALITATAGSAGAESIASFDHRLRRHGLPVVEP